MPGHTPVLGKPALAKGSAVSTAKPTQRVPLPTRAQELLALFPKAQFVLSTADKRDPAWRPAYPGALDLFSGSKRVAKQLINRGAPWVLCFEINDKLIANDKSTCDLELRHIRDIIDELVELMAFSVIGAAPVCGSFSLAVTPPVRTPKHPRGIPRMSPAMHAKVKLGNIFNSWLALLFARCVARSVAIWVENPDTSWWWRQRPWLRLAQTDTYKLFRVDYCRFGMRWRKRTRFATNIAALENQTLFCTRDHEHQILRGSNKRGVKWTHVAEPYPWPLASLIATGSSMAAGWIGTRRLDGEAYTC